MTEKVGQIYNLDLDSLNEKLRTIQRILNDTKLEIDKIKSILNLSYTEITIDQEQTLEDLMEDL